MLETPHVIVGAAIATKVTNPALSLPLSLASHFVLEKVPHWNPHLSSETKKFGKPSNSSTAIVVLDVILSLASGFYIASRTLPNSQHFISILLASFFAVLPDIVEGPYFFLGVRHELIKKWISIQKSLQVDASFIPGILSQIAIIIAAFWWILN